MKRGYALSPHGQVHFVVGGKGFPVVLIGPSKRSSRVFEDLARLLMPNYRVLCPDNLGFGGSDPLPADASIEMLATATLACLDEVGIDKAHIYGLHTGNKIAASIAANVPARVAKLVLAGHTHSIIPDQGRRNAVIGSLVSQFLKDDAGDEGVRALREWSALYHRISETWWNAAVFPPGRAIEEIALAKRVVTDFILSAHSTRELYEANFRYDLEADLKKVKAPTLVLEIATPDEDRDYGRQAENVCALIAGSVSATIYESEGHTHTLERRAPELRRILADFFA